MKRLTGRPIRLETGTIMAEVERYPFRPSLTDRDLSDENPTEERKMNLTVYSKPGCPLCDRAKDFLNTKSIEYVEIICPDIETRSKVYDALELKGMDRTMPQILLTGEDGETVRLGGCKELLVSGIQSLNVPGAFTRSEELPTDVIMDSMARQTAGATTPGFTLLPVDRFALSTIDFWIEQAIQVLGDDHPKIASARRRRAEVAAWQEIYGSKTPD